MSTMAVILWTVWFYYALHLFVGGKQEKAFILSAVLVGLIWHLHASLVLVLPIIPLAIYLSKKKLNFKVLVLGFFTFLLLSVPFLLFELKHSFLQTKAVYLSLTTNQHDIIGGVDKLKRVLLLSSKNVTDFLWGMVMPFRYSTTQIAMPLVFAFLVFKKKISRQLGILMFLWLLVFIAFFASNPKALSEYYLNGMVVIWIIIASVGISYLFDKREWRRWGILALFLFGVINIYRFLTIDVNMSGYLEKNALVSFIKQDALKQGYPCISVSYITSPGFDFGYRYLFWLKNTHINQPKSWA